MILELAPVFDAAGFGLSAPFSVDFYRDLEHLIPTEGTWQGSRKSCRSLYIDNYNNSFSIAVTTSAGTVRCPGYSQGFVNLNPGDNVKVASESAAVVSMALYTESKPPGFTARGNAPATGPSAPFTVIGTINLTANNIPDGLYYQSYDSFLYAVCIASRLVVKVDPSKNSVVTAYPVLPNISAACVGPNGVLLFGHTDGTYTKFDTTTGTESAPVLVDPNGKTINSIVWNSTQSKVWSVSSFDNLPFNFELDGSGISGKIGTYAMNKIRVDSNGDIFGVYTAGPYNLTKIVTGAGSTTVSNLVLGGAPKGIAKINGGNLYIGFNGNVKVYDSNLNYVSQITITGQDCRPIEIGGVGSNRVYIGNSTGIVSGIDVALRGVIGNVPSLNYDIASLAYADSSQKWYAGATNGSISYFNNA